MAKKPLPSDPLAEAQSALLAGERMLMVKKARESLVAFTQMTMPDPAEPDDPKKTRFLPAIHHHALAEALEGVEAGRILRLMVMMPPRSGKSELTSRRFPVWFAAKDPYRQVMFSTYSQEFADDFGRSWRQTIDMPVFRQVFPGIALNRTSRAADRMELTMNDLPCGGLMVAVGAGGALTGRGADLLLIDDPFKNSEEADSDLIREQRWNWFTKDAYTRLMPGGRVVVVMTRWHESDIIGRMFDSEYMDPEELAKWTILKLPAIKDGKALWPERYPLAVLEATRKMLGPRAWSALYQQEPSPDDGLYFKRDWIVPYRPDELPRNLRKYGASDHAVTTKQENDPVCLGCVGIDENDHIWVLPDLVWDHMETDGTVDAMLDQMKRHKPMLWWAEDDVIRKAIGPFLRKRMLEEKIYATIVPATPSRDKKTRARSIQGRMSMKMVHFPFFAPWYQDAYNELLKFPNGKHDDFVDWLAWIGRGLDSESSANAPRKTPEPVRVGSIEWIKGRASLERRQEALKKVAGGF